MNYKYYLGLVFLFVINLTVSDLQAQSQKEVKIGKQIWMTRNLDVSTFRNGDTIFEAKSKEDWVKAGESKRPAYCYFRYNSKYGKQFGKLYNWFAVNDTRGLAPKDYHIPSDTEWTVLADTLGGEDLASQKMKSKQGWKKNGKKSGNGDNKSGFNALPGGCSISSGDFFGIDEGSFFWSSSEDSQDIAWCRALGYKDTKVESYYDNKFCGLSVRCIRD